MSRWTARLPGLLVLAIAVYYAVWGGEYSLFDLRRLQRQQLQEEARLRRARAEVDSLRRAARLLEDDPATIERIARERFGMIAEGEVLYRFVEVGGDTTPAPPPTP